MPKHKNEKSMHLIKLKMNDIFLMKFHLNKVLVLNYLADWYDSFLLKKTQREA